MENHNKILNFLKRKGLCLRSNGKVSKSTLIYAYDTFLGTDMTNQKKDLKWYQDFAVAERTICERFDEFKLFSVNLFKEEVFEEHYKKN